MPLRPAKHALLRKVLVSSCAMAMMGSSGCKSGPSFPSFGWTRQPSPETLAGNGPTTTYPVPPSAGNTPTAIASKAAGTGTTANSTPTTVAAPQTGGAPPYAAVANGYTGFGASGTTPQPNSLMNRQTVPGFAANAAPGTPQPASTPNTPSPTYSNPPSFNTSPNLAGTANNYATPPGYAAPPNYTTPSAYAAPQNTPVNVASAAGTPGYGAPAAYSIPGGTPAPSASPAVGGFALPSTAAPPDASGSTAATQSGFTLPGMAAQPPTTLSTTTSALPPSVTPSPGSTAPSSGTAPGGYRPGSTAGAVSYPTTPYTTPSGSVYR
jgi:hypothetical protein